MKAVQYFPLWKARASIALEPRIAACRVECEREGEPLRLERRGEVVEAIERVRCELSVVRQYAVVHVEREQAHRVEPKPSEVTRKSIGDGVLRETRHTRQVDTEETEPCPAIVDEVPELGAHETVAAGWFGIQRREIREFRSVIEVTGGDLEVLDVRSHMARS